MAAVGQTGKPQFNVPLVEAVGAPITSFVTGDTQSKGVQDIFYVTAPVGTAPNLSVTTGLLVNQNSTGFTNLSANQTAVAHATDVQVALADMNGDGHLDFLMATSPTTLPAAALCIQYGTGTASTGAFNSTEFGCMGFNPSVGSAVPHWAYIGTGPFKTGGGVPQVYLEDSANNALYIITNNGAPGTGPPCPQNTSNPPSCTLVGFQAKYGVGLPNGLHTGPMYVGDFNKDGNTDLIINDQTGFTADVYFGNGDGTFQLPAVYAFDHHVHSLLLQDMDGDGVPDMVVEGDGGVIEIFKGSANGTFASTSEGGTSGNAQDGTGGHLAAVDPVTLNILTTTPVGLSVLKHSGLSYSLQGIYDIGPGRSSYALQPFFGGQSLDLAVDAPEGIAIVQPDGNGGFQTAHAYSSLAPALSSTAGKFRSGGSSTDVVVSTGAVQGQLLTNSGNGSYTTFNGVTNTSGGPSGIPSNLWSNVVSGDFNGDGVDDVAYSLTGLPATSGPGLYVQYGKGDGTFNAPVAVSAGQPGNNNLFGSSTTGDFNGDGAIDLANVDGAYTDTLLGQKGGNSFSLGLNAGSGNTKFDQIAAGFFKNNRKDKQDIVVEQGSSLVPYLNSGDGKNFTAKPALAGTPSPSSWVAGSVMMGDIDGDGNGDVAAVYYSPNADSPSAQPTVPSQLYIWWGNGDGSFGQPQIVQLTRQDYLGALATLNGVPDIVLADGMLVTVLYNQGNRQFTSDYGSCTKQSGCGELHYLAGEGINSLTVADVNGDGSPDLVVANGGTTLSNPLVLGGATKSSIGLTPNADVNTGGITVLVNNIVLQPVQGTLAANPEPSNVGQAFTVTLTLTGQAGTAPTGTALLEFGSTTLGNATVTPTPGSTTTSTATWTVPAGNNYQPGSYAMSAAYSGDGTYASNNTFTGTHIIGTHGTETVLDLCVGPTASCPATGYVDPPFAANLTMYYGQTYNGTAKVAQFDGNFLTGTTSFYDNYNGTNNLLCTIPTATGGSCPPTVGASAQMGTHVLTAVYSGDSIHTGSTSPTVTIKVLADTTTAAVVGVANPSVQGTPVTFTATLTGNAAPPTGTVSFQDGNATLGTGTLTPSATGLTSTATFTTSTLGIGTHPITAVYAGTQNFAAATSPVFNEQITALPQPGFNLDVTPNVVNMGVGVITEVKVTVTPVNGFNQPVALSCGSLPYEMTCTFLDSTVNPATGAVTTTLYVEAAAPHDCHSNTPYFTGSLGPGVGLPALAGVLALFLPGRKRWLRSLLAVVVIAGAGHLSGCGTCTDLGTRPATYTFQVNGVAKSGGSTQVTATETQPVRVNVVI